MFASMMLWSSMLRTFGVLFFILRLLSSSPELHVLISIRVDWSNFFDVFFLFWCSFFNVFLQKGYRFFNFFFLFWYRFFKVFYLFNKV